MARGEGMKLDGHSRSVRGVSFSPRIPHLFVSGAYDGFVNIYSAKTLSLITSCNLSSRIPTISAVRFFPDGAVVAVASSTKKFGILDVETGKEVAQFDNCVSNARDRMALATFTAADGKQFAVSTVVDGKGLIFFDPRSRQSIGQIPNIHDGTIRDIIVLKESWDRRTRGMFPLFQTASEDGKSKIIDFHQNVIESIDLRTQLYTLAHTPEPNDSDLGFQPSVAFGSTKVVIRGLDGSTKETFPQSSPNSPLWKLRYTSIGTELFSASDLGYVQRYRRTKEGHFLAEIVISHSNDIEDMDISINDEYLVTASQDTKVGLVRIREPTFGPSDFADLV